MVLWYQLALKLTRAEYRFLCAGDIFLLVSSAHDTTHWTVETHFEFPFTMQSLSCGPLSNSLKRIIGCDESDDNGEVPDLSNFSDDKADEYKYEDKPVPDTNPDTHLST